MKQSNSNHLLEHIVSLVLEQLDDKLDERKRKRSKPKSTSGSDKNWMQGLNINKGALSRALGIPEEEDIPMSVLKDKKRELSKKAEGDKKLSKRELTLLRRINLAINFKKMKK